MVVASHRTANMADDACGVLVTAEQIIRALTTAIIVNGRVLDAETGVNLIEKAKQLCDRQNPTNAPSK